MSTIYALFVKSNVQVTILESILVWGKQNSLVVACFHIFLDRNLCPTKCSAYLSVNIKTDAFADISHKLVPVVNMNIY